MTYKDNRDKLNKIANTWGSTGNMEMDFMRNKIDEISKRPEEQAKADPRLKMFKVYDGLSPREAYLVGWNNPELGMEALRQSQEARSRHYTGGHTAYYPVSYYGGRTNPKQNAKTKVRLRPSYSERSYAIYSPDSGDISIYNAFRSDADFKVAMGKGKHEVKHHATQGQPYTDYYNIYNLLPRFATSTMVNTAYTAMQEHPHQTSDQYVHMDHDTDPEEQAVGWHMYKQIYANKFNQLPPNNYDEMIEDGVSKGMFIKDNTGNIHVNPQLVNEDLTRGMEMLDAGFTYRNNLIQAPTYPKLPTMFEYLYIPWYLRLSNYYSKYKEGSRLRQYWDTMQRQNYPQAQVGGKINYMNPYIKVKG